MTIDPIDGTLGYIEYVNYAFENGFYKALIEPCESSIFPFVY